MSFERLGALYERHIIHPGLQPHFVVLISFLVTFATVRFITHSIRSGRRLPFVRNISHGGTHIHHLVPGILLLLLSGYLTAVLDPKHRDWIAAIYGVGAALTLDEFALWLHLEDVYWERAGRRSIDACIIFASSAGIVAVGGGFFAAVAREMLGL